MKFSFLDEHIWRKLSNLGIIIEVGTGHTKEYKLFLDMGKLGNLLMNLWVGMSDLTLKEFQMPGVLLSKAKTASRTAQSCNFTIL